MKKSIYILTLAAAFIGCTKESVSDIEITDGGDFAVYAVTADTKTTNDGMTTIWGTRDLTRLKMKNYMAYKEAILAAEEANLG